MFNPLFALRLHYGLAVVTALFGSVTAEFSCTQDGYYCIDCNIQVKCFNNEAYFLPCPTDYYCKQGTGQCTANSCEDFTCQPYPFVCPDVGNYPDLQSCSNYKKCSADFTWLPEVCPSDTVYDPCMRNCSANAVCHDPPVQCLAVGDQGPVPNNPEMFYVCTLDFIQNCVYPALNFCTQGIYNIQSQSCEFIGVNLCK